MDDIMKELFGDQCRMCVCVCGSIHSQRVLPQLWVCVGQYTHEEYYHNMGPGGLLQPPVG